MKWLRANWEPITAVSALLVAVAAFFATIFETYETRKFNRLSLDANITFDNVLSSLDNSSGIYLQSQGPGAARIKSLTVWYDNERLGEGVFESWQELTKRLGDDIAFTGSTDIQDGEVVRSDDDVQLMSLAIRDGADVLAVAERMEKLNLTICYCSLYGDCKYEWSGVDAPKSPHIREERDTCL